MGRRFKNYTVPLGTDVETGERALLGVERIFEHIDIVGPTGVGKTRSTILPWFMGLCRVPDASVILLSPKGDLCPGARDAVIGEGHGNRLNYFDPQQKPLVGFNPLKANGWPVARHAKMVRAAVAASRGQHSFDETPQLQRLLYLCLAIALEQQMTLIEAFRLLHPGRSAFRRELLPAVQDEFLRECLQWYDGLKDVRREELAASTLARLENFISDPLIRAILTDQDRPLDIGEVIRRHQILIVNLEYYRPLSPDDVSTLGRLLLNIILAHVFTRSKEDRSPVFLAIDEVQELATEDLARAVTLGRELRLGCVIAHQFPSQLKLSAENSHLFEAVQHNCRTKVVFGGMHIDELEGVTKELFIDQYNPWFVKDERTTLECEPIETRRSLITRSRNSSRTRGKNKTHARSTSHGSTNTMSHGSASGFFVSTGGGESLLPSGDIIETANDSFGSTGSDSWCESGSDSWSETKTTSDTTVSVVNSGWGFSVTQTPYTAYKKRRIVSSRTYLSQDEFLTLCLQKMKAQPRGHFVIKVPNHKAVFVRAHFVREPWVPDGVRQRALQRMHNRLLLPGTEEKAQATITPSHAQTRMVEFSEPPPPTFREEK